MFVLGGRGDAGWRRLCTHTHTFLDATHSCDSSDESFVKSSLRDTPETHRTGERLGRLRRPSVLDDLMDVLAFESRAVGPRWHELTSRAKRFYQAEARWEARPGKTPAKNCHGILQSQLSERRLRHPQGSEKSSTAELVPCCGMQPLVRVREVDRLCSQDCQRFP